MGSVTLSTRLTSKEAREIDRLATELGLDRGALLKQIIRKGYNELQIKMALEQYQLGTVTLSRAAEMSGLDLREILLRLPDKAVELNYDLKELRRDLEAF